MEPIQMSHDVGFIYIRYSKDRIRPWIVNFKSKDYFCYELKMQGSFWGSQPIERPGGEINGFGYIVVDEENDTIEVFCKGENDA